MNIFSSRNFKGCDIYTKKHHSHFNFKSRKKSLKLLSSPICIITLGACNGSSLEEPKKNIVGTSLDDIILGGVNASALTGGDGCDRFELPYGVNIITDLETCDSFMVGEGAVLNAHVESQFVASFETSNFGSTELSAKDNGSVIDMTAASNGTFTIIGGDGSDLLTGGILNDLFIGSLGSDTYTIKAGSDSISGLSTGDNLVVFNGATANATGISEFIATTSTSNAGVANLSSGNDGSTITLTESANGSYTLIGGSGVDHLTGGRENDTLSGSSNSDFFYIVGGVDKVTDLSSGDSLIVSSEATANATGISEFIATTLTSNAGVANLSSGNDGSTITLTESANGAYSLIGGLGVDLLTGGNGHDSIFGASGHDQLDGGVGNDILNGGSGNDTFIIGAGIDTVDDLVTGDNLIVRSGATVNAPNIAHFVATTDSSNAGIANLTAGDSGSIITLTNSGVGSYNLVGGAGVDVLNAAEGSDTLFGQDGDDFLDGGLGNDILTGGSHFDTFNVSSGTDRITDLATGDILIVSYGATANATDISLFTATNATSNRGTANVIAADAGSTITLTNSAVGPYNIFGGSGVDVLTGANESDYIRGNSNDDILDGAGGSDTLRGGDGNDTFKITSGTDLINDLTTGDILIVSAGATANAQNVSHFIATSATSNAGTANLTASNDGATITLTESSLGAYTITGGSSIDSLTGDVDADTLQGGDGADTLVGGNGNDLYLFNTGDVDNGESIVEDPGGGSDAVAILTTTDFSNITVASFNEIEEIRFAGSSQVGTVTGAHLSDETIVLTETAAGVSELIINVAANATVDFSKLTATTFTIGSDIVTINVASGNTNITFPNFAVSLNMGSGDDTLDGGTGADTLDGKDGNDTIDGGDGADTLIGGSGNDVYLFDTNDVDAGESITENASGGTDVIGIVTSTDFTNMTSDSFNEIEQIRFAGSSKTGTFTGAQLTGETLLLTETATGTSNLIINVASGTTASLINITASTFTDGSDTITINGSTGNETITAPNLAATINAGSGDDTINAAGGSDTIDGGDGSDSLVGGGGDDIYLFDTNDVDSGESITEAGGGGTDAVAIVTSTDFSLMTNASFDEIEQIRFAGSNKTGTFTGAQFTGETLSLIETSAGTSNLIINVASGTTATFINLAAGSGFTSGSDTVTINGTSGNENITGANIVSTINGGLGDDTVVAGSQNDTIDGGDGADSLTGGSGDDVYLFDANDVDSGEAIVESGGGGTDVISLDENVDFSLMSEASFDEIEQIRFAGSSKTGTFTGAQLTTETIALTETGSGTNNLIVEVALGTTVNLSNLSNGSGWDNGSDTITVNGVDGGGEIIAGPNIHKTSIFGKSGNDNITGGNGNDTINGGDGDDTMNGGAGTNTLSYSDATAGITINLASGGAQNTGGAGIDTVSNFLNLIGSANNDVLTGDSNANTINSGGGGDIITGGEGADIINLNATSETDTIKLQGAWDSDWVGDAISNFETGNDIIDFLTNYARIDGSAVSSFNSGITIDDSTAFIREGTTIASGASATVSQVTANLTVGTFDDGDGGGSADRIYVAWDDGSNTYVGALVADNSGDGFSGDSLTLIFTFTGLSDCTTLSASNFSDFS